MNFLMTFPTHDQCFPSSCCHLFDPGRFFPSSWLFQISELTDMVDLYLLFRSAKFALIRKDSFEEFTPVRHQELGLMVYQNCVRLPFQRETPKLGNERLFIVPSLDHDLEALPWAVGRLGRCLVLACHCSDRGLVFARQCFQE